MDIQSLNASQLRERAVNQGSQRSSAAASGSTTPSRSADNIELSTTAQALRDVSADTRVPFDQQRVESIRQAIAEGRYHIDPDRLASNFMRIEHDLFQ